MTKIKLIFSAAILAFSPIAQAQVTQEQQQALTPEKVLSALLEGNSRFVSGKTRDMKINVRIAASVSGQYPKAVILSCLDSRVPVEQAFDVGIGDIFVGRVAGNIVNEDQLGSMEFATKLAGAKLVMVLGHSSCGAVGGACDGAKLGHLTNLLAKILPAVKAVEGFSPKERTSANKKFLASVVEKHIRLTVANIRKNSPILSKLEQEGKIKIVGAYYELKTGKISVLDNKAK